MFFNILYDVLWFLVIYVVFYKGVDYAFREYAQAIKVLFDVNVRLFNYNSELGVDERHDILFTCSTIISFVILTINPVLHSILYMTLMFMIDVVDLNRILLYILLFKVAKKINPFALSFKKLDPLLVVQILLVIVNYHNVSIAVPVLFQIIDESTDLNFYFRDILRAHDFLLGGDTRVKEKFMNITLVLESRKKKVISAKIVILSVIAAVSFLYSQLATWGEVGFYYYAVARIAHIYRYDTFDKIA